MLGLFPALQLVLYAYRPFNGTDAAVADHGELELEVGPSGVLVEGDERLSVIPALIANYGIVERWELVLEGRGFLSQRRPRARLGDTALSLKGVVVPGVLQDHGRGPSVALELGPQLPQWNEGDNGLGAQAAVIVSERAAVGTAHLNAAAALTRARTGAGFLGLIVEGPFDWVARPVAEGYVERETGSGAQTTSSLLGGVIWRVAEGFDADVGVRAAREGRVSSYEIRAGFTWGVSLFGH